MKSKDLITGNKIEINFEPYLILDSTFMNPGRGQAFHKLKLKNMLTNSIITKTTKIGEKLKEANIDSKILKYLYKNDDILYFYDEKTFDYYEINLEKVKNSEKWIKEGLNYEITFWNNNPIDIKHPKFIELKIISADVYDKKSCASKTSKNAILETGLTIKVPVFIKENDIIKIDTEKEEYISRI
ncbi:MAG TPA: elongation factor P [Candidatus Azoamicus sp. MARI]